jgi:hypothetical protein
MARVIPSRIVRYIETWLLRSADKMLGALQFLGNLFEYFLVRRNQGKKGTGEFTEVF